MRQTRLILFAALGLAAAAPALAQPSSPAPALPPATAPAAPAPMLRSPEIYSDGSVTFRYMAPRATAVSLTGEVGASPMTRDARGVWSVTKTLSPGTYAYGFTVDGVNVPDPANRGARITNWAPGLGQSTLDIKGPGTPPWVERDVPHGQIALARYFSGATGSAREYYVYTPPGYDVRRRAPYPVLYLLHGRTDDATAWVTKGRANAVLDNLIAETKAVPMVVVMPTGYGVEEIDELGTDIEGQKPNLERFTAALLTEVMLQVERAYNVSTRREDRAIAGLSMGGMEATSIGLNHPELFTQIGAFSPAYRMLGLGQTPTDYGPAFPGVGPAINRRIKLFWMASGDTDTVVGAQVTTYRAWLAAKRIDYQFTPEQGGHEWRLWRQNIVDFLPLLFRK